MTHSQQFLRHPGSNTFNQTYGEYLLALSMSHIWGFSGHFYNLFVATYPDAIVTQRLATRCAVCGYTLEENAQHSPHADLS